MDCDLSRQEYMGEDLLAAVSGLYELGYLSCGVEPQEDMGEDIWDEVLSRRRICVRIFGLRF